MASRKTVEYRIEIPIISPDRPGGIVWRNGGTVKGWSKKAVLRRAAALHIQKPLAFMPHNVEAGEVYHARYRDRVVLRLVEV